MSKTYWSNWHITVNANQREKSRADRLVTARILSDAVEEAVQNPRHLWYWLRYYKRGQGQIDFPPAEQAKVERVRARVSLEGAAGKGARSVHVHILIEVQHRTRVQIDEARFREVLVRETGFDNLNTKSRFVRGNGEDKEYLLRYLQKEGKPERVARDPDNRALQRDEEVHEVEEQV